MSDGLRELYQEVILDHNKRPRHRGVLPKPTGRADGYNPLCGDQVTVTLIVAEGRIREIAFDGMGCAICTASSSMMTEKVLGRTIEEVETVFRTFQAMVTDTTGSTPPEDLGELSFLAGVRDHPVRIKCATLAWHTLHAALRGEQGATSES